MTLILTLYAEFFFLNLQNVDWTISSRYTNCNQILLELESHHSMLKLLCSKTYSKGNNGHGRKCFHRHVPARRCRRVNLST